MARPDLTAQRVAGLILGGHVDGVVQAFEGANDADRSRVRPGLETRKWSAPGREGPMPTDRAAAAAWAAVEPPATIARDLWQFRNGDQEMVEGMARAIEGRTDRFRAALAKQLLASQWGGMWVWPLVRRLVRSGAIDPSVNDEGYIRLMATCQVPDLLSTDPDLAHREVWRLFEVPNAVGDWTVKFWTPELVKLAGTSDPARERLLDACLAALATDFAPRQLAGYAQILDALAPTDEELAARAGTVLGLCSGPPLVQKSALGWVERLVGAVEHDDLADVLRAPLAGSQRNLADSALKLLDRLAATSPAALAVVATGLAHPHPEVARRALGILRQNGLNEHLRAEVAGYVDLVPAAVRGELVALAGIHAAPAVAHRPAAPTTITLPAGTHPDAAARYAPDRRLEPITQLDELVAVVAVLLEGQGNGDDVERTFAALARMAGDKPHGFADAVSPVRKRAQQMLAGQMTGTVVLEVAYSVITWADGGRPKDLARWMPFVDDETPSLLQRIRRRTEKPSPTQTLGFFIRSRFAELRLALAAGRSRPALSEPTHRGGHLDPAVLASRSGGLGPFDERQARLRAGLTGGRPTLMPIHTQVSKTRRYDEFDRGLRFQPAAGGGQSSDPLVASAVAFLGLQGKAAVTRAVFQPQWDTMSPHDSRAFAAALATRPDMVAAFGAIGLAERLAQSMHVWYSPVPMLEMLTDATVPLDGSALTLLALGLSAPVEYRAVAVDTAVAAVADGRMDAEALGRELAALHGAGLVVLTRLGEPFTEIAACGDVHRAVAQRALLTVVASVDGRPSGLHGPLDALVTLAAGAGTDIPAWARPTLEDLAGRSSRAGKAAKAVLQSAVPVLE